ncbi:acetyl-CoA carboxylase biotin carboxyl carrier protein subunit [Enterococcus canis]|uniref:Acetyl-CoA carboxylase biotin carboxyl carrier protein subunit n=1 Tax=Enterococcus canis TaxID=214095 RepID=A0A1L8RG42_9ENTE|nr:acetyl-CoA carboxylase biotin carboxyl carrier protein subunit [Enterococcus canis]OJG18707.1 acetyl-CoA carboxylase biotin carboxyl carrier protein subunit [Enterococcus canis]
MLRKFKITINGTEYLVEMEEIGGTPQPATPVAPPTVPVQESAPQPTPAAPAPSAHEGEALLAPMPGTILKVLVAPGDAVTENQPLMILEAMKMENEIVATQTGHITGLFVKPGDTVNPGDQLIAIG